MDIHVYHSGVACTAVIINAPMFQKFHLSKKNGQQCRNYHYSCYFVIFRTEEAIHMPIVGLKMQFVTPTSIHPLKASDIWG